MSYTDDNGETTYDLEDVVDAITRMENSLDSRLASLEEHLEQIASSTGSSAGNMQMLSMIMFWVGFPMLGFALLV